MLFTRSTAGRLLHYFFPGVRLPLLESNSGLGQTAEEERGEASKLCRIKCQVELWNSA